MRVLITIAPLSYRQVLMLAFRRLCPRVEVIVVGPEELDTEVERFAPDLVVCDTVTQRVRAGVASWVEILFENDLDANVCVGGVSSRLEGFGIEDLLAVSDEVEQLTP